jgi:uncharacterized protein YjbI with pentapeptide repeats
LIHLAQSGDPDAIAQILNTYLVKEGIQVSASKQEESLLIMLLSPRLPDQSRLIPWLQRSLNKLQPRKIHSVTVTAARQAAEKGEKALHWHVTFVVQTGSGLSQAPEMTEAEVAARNVVSATLIQRYTQNERDFQRLDLSYLNLQGQKLSMGNFHHANLQGSNLSQTNFSQADLSQADLSQAQLSGANFHNANLAGANLQGANLRGANLTWASLAGANLYGADLDGANLRETDFTMATLPDGTVLD